MACFNVIVPDLVALAVDSVEKLDSPFDSLGLVDLALDPECPPGFVAVGVFAVASLTASVLDFDSFEASTEDAVNERRCICI